MPTRSPRPGPRALSRRIRLAGLFAAASLVAACGGGGGDSGGSDPFAGLTVPDAPSATATAKLPSGLSAGRAAHCADLADTDYRFVSPRRNSSLADMIGVLEVDALQLEVNTPTGTALWIPARRTCEFEEIGTGGQIVVSQSGVIVGTSIYTAPVIAFPMQSFDVPQLAGQWTALGQLNKGSDFVNVAADIAIATNGAVARLEVCEGVANCADPTHPTSSVLVKNADGGFDLSLLGWGKARLFAYQAGASGGLPGEMMVVMVREDGSFLLMTRRRTRTLPTVTTDFQTHWNLIVSPQGVTSPLEETSVRIDALPSSSTFLRTTKTPTTAERQETITINSPHTGYQHRPRAGTPSYSEWTLMPLRGMGFSALALTETNRFMFSVAQSDVPSAVPSLPQSLAGLPAASGCSALRSTSYRVITPTPGNDIAANTGLLTMNAATMRSNLRSDPAKQWVASAAPCRYSSTGDQLVVAQSGVISALKGFDTGTSWSYRPIVGFPVQAFAVGELAGTWNAMAYEWSSSTSNYTGRSTTLTIDPAGAVTALTDCDQDNNCANAPTPIDLRLSANADGGFDFGSTGGPVDRIFAYRAGGGELMAMRVSANGSFALLTRQRRATLPTVTRGFSKHWDLIVETSMRVREVIESSERIDAVNTGTRSYTRTWFEAGPTMVDTFRIDQPRIGYQYRAGNTSTAPATDEATRLDFRGMGLRVSIEPFWFSYGITVDRP